MFDIVIRRGDTLPVIAKFVYAGGSPVDLSGYTAKFTVNAIDGTQRFEHNATIDLTAPNKNLVTYQWAQQDTTDTPDEYAFARFTVTSGSSILTVPNNRPMSLRLTTITSQEFSYSGNPSARDIDRVRFLLQDTNLNSALFTDAEILFMVEELGNAYEVAAELAMIQSAKFSNLADKTVGPLSISYGDLGKRWASLSLSLRNRGRRNSGALAITTQSSNAHIFEIGMHDYTQSTLFDVLTGEENLP